jgi:pyrroline-5-carboxylate reductase
MIKKHEGAFMKIAVIGCGVMGTAFARHFAKMHSVTLSDRNSQKTKSLSKEIGAAYQENLSEAVRSADIIFLAVKPKDLIVAAQQIAPVLKSDQILISILAATSVEVLKSYLPHITVVRAMPNIGLNCGHGVIGLVNEQSIPIEARKTVDLLLTGLGLNIWLSEDKIEALSALSGSGIAFVLVMIEAMIEGGVLLGLNSKEAREIVLKTMEGAVALLQGSDKHPAELKLHVCSPGGTTIAGLKAMEEAGVRAGILQTLTACHEKALKMMKPV